ncbi:MAG: OmpA family protein [Desulfobulbus sp.]|uniref:OmpA family protein n=1 Tax=Desulfobulbus sp. TaxID=895 RepID=UPI002842FA09|nr:OmpA family protein [Desulfobulbus sp.]MDR2551066.1 OmpA family protein [Desulfobulbus sp.]
MKRVLFGLICCLLVASGCAMDRSAQNKMVINEAKKLDITAKETSRGVEINFPEVLLFDFDSDQLRTDSQIKMQAVATILNKRGIDSRKLAVEGHTDSFGTPDYNLMLSQRRAESVARSLVFSGVARERMEVKGLGMAAPIAANTHPNGTDNPEGRAQNRRVEVIVEN